MTLSILSFLLSWIVLAFFVSLLLNIIDAVYICFAMDRDMQVGSISRSDCPPSPCALSQPPKH